MQISKPKGFALASSQGTSACRDAVSHHLVLCRQSFCKRDHMQETALLYLGTSPYKENNSLYNYYGITKILQPRTAVGPDLKMSVLSAIALQFIQVCISHLSQCKSTYKTQYPSTSLHRSRYWVQSLTRPNVELAAVLYTQKATFYRLGRDCQSKKNINASSTSYQSFQGIPQAQST